MKLSPARTFLFLFAGTLAVMIATNHAYYFSTPYHEQGDAALNALQIEHAKSFDELHGNYSRFRFHHPGPAFFYLYAWSELLLCDGLHFDLSPYNAHALAGLATQVAFFALALTIAAQWIRARLFLPLALLVAAIHFSVAGNAFWSLWPPHVLLMPFLAFWLACVSMACGRGNHLVWVALAGSVLVHAHVAQPLFVVSLAGLSYTFLFFRARKENKSAPAWRIFPRAHWAAAGVILLFSLPLLLDGLQGDQSNFAQIIRHTHDNAEQLKKPLKSLLYLLSFFGYVHNQDEALRELSPDSLLFFRENWPAFAAWFLILLTGALALRPLRQSSPDGRRFWSNALIFWVGTLVLNLIWGVLQTGRMYEFNAHFFYSVIYLATFPAIAWLARQLEPHLRLKIFGALILMAASAIAARGFLQPRPSPEESGLDFQNAVQKALASDAQPGSAKLLVFDHDDWPQAAAVALTLQRSGITYFVDKPWWFMFSAQHTAPDAILRQTPVEASIWRFLPASEMGDGLSIGHGLKLVFETPALASAEGVVDFSQYGNYLQFLVAGFSNLQGSYAWMCQDNAVLQFRPAMNSRMVVLDLTIVPFLPPAGQVQPPLEVYYNGRLITRTTITAPGHLVCRIEQARWCELPVATLRLSLAGAHNPFEPGLPRGNNFGSLSIRRLVTHESSD